MKVDEERVAADVRKVERALQNMTIELSQELPAPVAFAAVDKIRVRTLSGRDVAGRVFKHYAPATMKRGTKPQSGTAYSNPPNLQDSGAMLNAVEARKKGKGAVLQVRGDQARKAEAHQFGAPARGLPQRRWFGISKKDANRIGKDIDKDVTKVITRNRGDAYTVQGKGFKVEKGVLVVVNPGD